MLVSQNDPIIAIATAPGRGAVGVVRISGRDLDALMAAVLKRKPSPRIASYLPFLDAEGAAIDHGIALYFPAPHSFTGEDVLELQAHGGGVVLQMLLERCLQAAQEVPPGAQKARLAGLRVAEAGEFTKRAFLNNKMDLAQAESVADLIDASTQTAARSAARSLSGVFSQKVNAIRTDLIHLRMLVEATLDFPEEEIDFLRKADALGQLTKILDSATQLLGATKQGALLRDGIKIVIAGQPNAGKSSLLNALAGVELAIVTSIAGTTRDKIEQTLQIDGVPIHVIDTAGLRESEDEIELLGMARTWQEIEGADAVLFLHDLSKKDEQAYQQLELQIGQKIEERLPKSTAVLDVWNKIDLTPSPDIKVGLAISARTGQGLDRLRKKLLELAGWNFEMPGVFMARTRHVHAIVQSTEHLKKAVHCLSLQVPPLDLMAEELRLAQNTLNTITGEFSSEDLLGEIFSRFCIGK